MTAMFETLDDLNRTLPQPKLTGDIKHDFLAREQYISNAKKLRSEAFASLVRSLAKTVHHAWSQLTAPRLPVRSQQV